MKLWLLSALSAGTYFNVDGHFWIKSSATSGGRAVCYRLDSGVRSLFDDPAVALCSMQNMHQSTGQRILLSDVKIGDTCKWRERPLLKVSGDLSVDLLDGQLRAPISVISTKFTLCLS